MKQTAVEQLIEQLTAIGQLEIPNGSNAVTSIIDKAKQMEKEQIMKARQDIFHTGNLTAEQYYNETFKSE